MRRRMRRRPRLVDLSTPLNADTKLELVKENDPEALKVVRHSAAHVLATAVLELFPETKLGHGPATDAGFFYDFLSREAIHAGRSGGNRNEDGRSDRAG